MLPQKIIVFDFETGSNRRTDCEIVQIAAAVIEPRNLTLIKGAEFESLMRPLEPDKLQDEALKVNKKTREQLAKAPHPAEVWAAFARFCAQWNFEGKTTDYCAPIPAGHNILGFDLPIYERYANLYKTTRIERNGEVVPSIFNNRYRPYDTMQLMGYWTENLTEPGKLSLDYLRRYFGMPKASIENAHDALQDVRDTAAILTKLINLSRTVSHRVLFKDCFDPEAQAKTKAEKEAAKAAKAEKEAERKRKKTWSKG